MTIQNPLIAAPAFDPARRRLLKTGIAGSLLLVSARWVYPAQALAANTTSPYLFLTHRDITILQRIMPVMLQGALLKGANDREQAISAVLANLDDAVNHLSLSTRGQIRDLFNLLGGSLGRVVLAGVWQPWETAEDKAIESFLNRWQTSRIDLFRSAYKALHDLSYTSWYGNPNTWASVGYPGPPKLA